MPLRCRWELGSERKDGKTGDGSVKLGMRAAERGSSVGVMRGVRSWGVKLERMWALTGTETGFGESCFGSRSEPFSFKRERIGIFLSLLFGS